MLKITWVLRKPSIFLNFAYNNTKHLYRWMVNNNDILWHINWYRYLLQSSYAEMFVISATLNIKHSFYSTTLPFSVPTVPLRPRKYVTYHRHYLSNSMEIEVEFRWSRPRKVNGRIMQYRVFQASDPSGPWIPQPRIYPKRRYHTINKAKPNTTYYFKVL